MGQVDLEPMALSGVPAGSLALEGRPDTIGDVAVASGSTFSGASAPAATPARRRAASRSRGPLARLAIAAAALAAPVMFHGAAVDAPPLRAALETMMTLFALAGAWLLRAQFVSSRRLRDLLLVGAVLALGVMNFGTAALPAALDLSASTYFATARLFGELFVGGLLVAAAFAPAEWLVAKRRDPLVLTVGVSLAVLAAAGLGGLLVRAHPSSQSLAAALGHPVAMVVVVTATGVLGYAAIGFTVRQTVEGNAVDAILAMATTLIAGASFSHLLPGSLRPGRIDVSDAMRALAFALILAAAAIGERQVRARTTTATALAERRRVARDLHDGIAQDLAFIAAHGARIAEQLGDEHPVVLAARRALAVSRSTISDLSSPDGATLHESLEAIAQELRDRFDVAIAIDVQPDVDLEPEAREHVSRIAREAIANGARHGGARNVIVSLRQTDKGVALRVLDDGCGIAGVESGALPEGFGLRSMRERATALGGQLTVRQPQRGGTELKVVLP